MNIITDTYQKEILDQVSNHFYRYKDTFHCDFKDVPFEEIVEFVTDKINLDLQVKIVREYK